MGVETFTIEQVATVLRQMAEDLEGASEDLRDLDAALGDGDLGITVTLGFRRVREVLPALMDGDIGTLVAKSGMSFNQAAASTMGALFATMMMRAGKVVQGKREISADDVVAMARAAEEGLRERGKVQPGDKTMLDAIVPAVQAMTEAHGEGSGVAEMLLQAAEGAQAGAIATREMQAKVGRASWLGERTVGPQDPGATAITLMLRSVSRSLAAERA